jgi:hypothetical protein
VRPRQAHTTSSFNNLTIRRTTFPRNNRPPDRFNPYAGTLVNGNVC